MGLKWTTRGLLLGGCLLIVVWALGCGETGPQGPPGKDGRDAATTCFNCHNDSPADTLLLAAKVTEYGMSKHGSGDTWAEKSTPCNGCHTHEGFIDRVAAGMPAYTAFPPAMSTSSRIGCWTCHGPHTNGNFSLRTQAPVTLFAADAATINLGEGNLCASCHQARPANPPIPTTDTDSIKVTSTRWGPHHSGQGNMLGGAGGYFSATHSAANSQHNVLLTSTLNKGCVMCHMATGPTSNGSFAGGHTWSTWVLGGTTPTPYLASCNASGCHSAAPLTNFDHNARQTEITGLLTQVHDRLVARGIIDATTDLMVANKFYKANQLKAAWNYLQVEADRSLGVHNTNYARAMLQSSLDFVP